MSNSRIDEHWLATYNSLITVSIEGFKFSALANGGAAVALLAYVGNVVGKCEVAPDMRLAMAPFLLGLGLCGVSMLFAYLTQLRLLNEERPKRNIQTAHGEQTERVAQEDRIKPASHATFLTVAIALWALSLLSFGVGAWQAVLRFH